MKVKLDKIHAIVVAAGVTMSEDNIVEGNLKGTLKDKIHLEDFCYNFQKYQLHKSIQLSEETAWKVKIPKTEQNKHETLKETKEEPNVERNAKDNKKEQKIENTNQNDKHQTIEANEQKEIKSENLFSKIINRNFASKNEKLINIHNLSKMEEKLKELSQNVDRVKFVERMTDEYVEMDTENLKDQKANLFAELNEDLKAKFSFISDGTEMTRTRQKILDLFKATNTYSFIMEWMDLIIEKNKGRFLTNPVEYFQQLDSEQFDDLIFYTLYNMSDTECINTYHRLMDSFHFQHTQETKQHSRPQMHNEKLRNSRTLIDTNSNSPKYVFFGSNQVLLPLNLQRELARNENDENGIHPLEQDSILPMHFGHDPNQNQIVGKIDHISNQITFSRQDGQTESGNVNQTTNQTSTEDAKNESPILQVKTDINCQNQTNKPGEKRSYEIRQLNANGSSVDRPVENKQQALSSKPFSCNHDCYSPDDVDHIDIIKVHIEHKVKRRLMEVFNNCQRSEKCILFLTGHGDEKGRHFILNNAVGSQLTLDDVIELWNNRETKCNNHLLIIIDACFLGKWTHDMEWDPKYKDVVDISIQTSSNQYQTSTDSGADTGGCFMNNLLYVNGMRDLMYNYDYKSVDDNTGKPKDGQTPTFFTRLDDIESAFRLKIGFNNWESMERRVKKTFRGTFIDDGGDIIKGHIKSMQLHGEGQKRLANGRTESGHFKNDRLHGRGKIEWKNMVCEGVFHDGRLTEDYKARLSSGTSIPDLSRPIDHFKLTRLVIDTDMIKEIRTISTGVQVHQRHTGTDHSNGPVTDRPISNATTPLDQMSGVHTTEGTPPPSVSYEWIRELFNNGTSIEGECRNGKRHGFNFTMDGDRITRAGIWQNNEFIRGVDASEEGRLTEVSVNTIDKHLFKMERGDETNRSTSPNDEHPSTDGHSRVGLMDVLSDKQFWSYWNVTDETSLSKKADMEFIGEFNPRVKQPPNGRGVLKKSNGMYYDGHWKNGMPHGFGQYHNPLTNEGYSGYWNHGMREGNGRMVFGNRECYEGNWQSDRAIGWGKYTDSTDNTSEGFIILSDDQLANQSSRLFAFSGTHRWSEEMTQSKRRLTHELDRIDREVKSQFSENSDLKKSLVDTKSNSKIRVQLNEIKMVKIYKFDNFIKISDDFTGCYWNGSYYGFCRFKNSFNENIGHEFYDNKWLVRNTRLDEFIEGYQGDILVSSAKNFNSTPSDEFVNPLSTDHSFTKHGFGRLETTDQLITHQYSGWFFLDQQTGKGRQTTTSSMQILKDTNVTGEINDRLISSSTRNDNRIDVCGIHIDDKPIKPSVVISIDKIGEVVSLGDIIEINECHHIIHNQFSGIFNGMSLLTKVSMSMSDNTAYSGFAIMDKILFDFPIEYGLYRMNWSNVRMCGYGSHRGDVTGRYTGWLVNNKRQGQGQFNSKRTEYEGEFFANHFHGKGSLRDKLKKTTYRGDIRFNLKHGWGRLVTDAIDIGGTKIVHDGVESVIKVCDSEYIGEFKNDLYWGEGELTRKYSETIRNIKFHETNDGGMSDEFKFHSSDYTQFSISKQSDDLLVGTLKIITLRQSVVSPFIYFQNNVVFEFSDFSTTVLNFQGGRMHVFCFAVSDQIDLTKGINWSKYQPEIVTEFVKVPFFESFVTHNNTKYEISAFTSENQTYCRVDKVVYQSMDFACKDFNQNSYRFTFTGTNNEVYRVTLLKHPRSKKRDVMMVEKQMTETYKGGFERGQKHGRGVMRLMDGSLYEGHFRLNRFSGHGRLVTPANVIYDGEFANGMKEGTGTETHPYNQTYTGQFRNNVRNGRGRLVHSKEGKEILKYEGTFKEGLIEGLGRLNYVHVDQFADHDELERYEEHGMLKYDREFEYDGEFKKGAVDRTGLLRSIGLGLLNIDCFERNKIVLSNLSIQINDEVPIVIKGPALAEIDKFENFKRCLKFQHFEDEIVQSIDNSKYFIFNKQIGFYQSHLTKDDYVGNRISFDCFTGDCRIQLSPRESEIPVKVVHGCIVSHGSFIRDDNTAYTGHFLLKKRKSETQPSKWSVDRHFDMHLVHGYGVGQDGEGSLMVGEYSCGQFREGVLIKSNSDLHVGNWKEGRMIGPGQSWLANGEVYQGNMEEGMRKGVGLLMNSEVVYFGEFVRDKFSGNGELVSSDSQCYSGQFQEGLKHGLGKLSFNSDYHYSGTFVNDSIEGYGQFKVESVNDVREGQCLNGMMEGYGLRVVGNDHSYEGLFEKDRYHSYGELKTPSLHYQGHFMNGKYHGQGILSKNKYVYEGYFREGMKEGFSKIEYNNKVKVYGMFRENELEGRAQLHQGDDVKECLFHDSKIKENASYKMIKNQYNMSGEYLISPTELYFEDNHQRSNHRQILHGEIKIDFSYDYQFEGRFNCNFHEKEITLFDCLFLKLSRLDVINGKLLLEPTSHKNRTAEGEDMETIKGRITDNCQFLNSLDSTLFNSIFDIESQKSIVSRIDEYLSDLSSKSDFETFRLLHSHFDSHSEVFEKLLGDEIDQIVKYEGTFANGMWYEGTVTYKNGDRLKGKYSNYQIKGKGKKTFGDGSVYEGPFVNRKMHGHGIMRYSNGIEYEGQFKDDKMEHSGSLTLPELSPIHVRVIDGLILRRVKRKMLSNGLNYSGECLMRLNTCAELTEGVTLEDLLEYERESGVGVYSERSVIHKIESEVSSGVRVVEEFRPDGSVITRINNPSVRSYVVRQTFENGTSIIHIRTENDNQVKLIRNYNQEWYFGPLINQLKTGEGFIKLNAFRSQLLMFENDEFI